MDAFIELVEMNTHELARCVDYAAHIGKGWRLKRRDHPFKKMHGVIARPVLTQQLARQAGVAHW